MAIEKERKRRKNVKNNEDPGPSVVASAVRTGPLDGHQNDIEPEELPAMSAEIRGGIYSTDPGCWLDVTEDARHYWINKGPVPCQNRDGDFTKSEKHYEHQKRSLSSIVLSQMVRLYRVSGFYILPLNVPPFVLPVNCLGVSQHFLGVMALVTGSMPLELSNSMKKQTNTDSVW